jgi:ABC-type polysaccharide/polyol phosphate transport system ATPase subunit
MRLRIGYEISQSVGGSLAVDEMIRLEEVSVRYRVPKERIATFKEYAIRLLQRRVIHDEFWALRNVSLRVNQGEVFGIIGPNGAGKSTLLKLVARVLYPTKGRVIIRGHVAPMLEFSAGFHPELTGRENIYLFGSLIGHTRREIRDRFGSIIEFADIGDFIDAPLRTYSSGMVARLGFAIATEWRPDVLIVDEVLAVGDAAFSDKSSARMRSFRDQGVTILLVSHNMKLVEEICGRIIWLQNGIIRGIGSPDEVIPEYLHA